MDARLKIISSYIILPILACFCLFILEQVLTVDYFTKTISKLFLFISIPLLAKRIQKPLHKGFVILHNRSLKNIMLGVFIGLGIIIIILVSYKIFGSYIDSTSIIEELNKKSKITKQNYAFIGMYIIFVNSFIEEFFFRNFIFLNLFNINWNKSAFLVSSLLFSIYHVAIFNTWFSPGIILLSLCGLFFAGIILCYINTKTNSMVNSWIVHICADIAVISIGYMWLCK